MGILSAAADTVTDSINNAIDSGLFQVTKGFTAENSSVVEQILSKKWDMTDDFQVAFVSQYLQKIMPDYINDFYEMMNYAIVNVTLPMMSAQEIESVIQGTRRVNVKLQESFRFEITFRDYSGGILRKMLTALWIAQQFEYFDDVKSHITIMQNNALAFTSDNCLILSIGTQTYDHNNTGFSEFTVSFISPSYTDEFVRDFGIDLGYSDSFMKTIEFQEDKNRLMDTNTKNALDYLNN